MPKQLHSEARSTIHPLARSLYNHMALCAERLECGATDWYSALQYWREAQDLGDDRMADLYSRIEEGFTGFYTDTSPVLIERLSDILWDSAEAMGCVS